MRRVKQGAATRMHSGRLDPVGLTINFKMTPSRFNHFLLILFPCYCQGLSKEVFKPTVCRFKIYF